MVCSERDFQNFFITPDDMIFSYKTDMPIMKGIILKKPEKVDLVGFNYAKLTKPEDRKDKTVHFFLSDYLFERCWTHLKDNIKLLSQYKFVFTPDFSQYTDMPQPMRMWNHYRKQWLGAYWQMNGVRVIPTICWSDKKSYEYCFDGVPKNACVAISGVGWAKTEKAIARNNADSLIPSYTLFREGVEETINRLHPRQILWYGTCFDWVKSACEDNDIQLVEFKPDYTKRFERTRQ